MVWDKNAQLTMLTENAKDLYSIVFLPFHYKNHQEARIRMRQKSKSAKAAKGNVMALRKQLKEFSKLVLHIYPYQYGKHHFSSQLSTCRALYQLKLS